MNLPTIIDVAIGLVLMFFILSTLGSVLAEFVAAHQKWRHKLLRETITRLLEPESTRQFWTHALILPLFIRTPQISTATKPKWRAALDRRVTKTLKAFQPRIADAPAYLDSTRFASVVLDLATGQGAFGRVPATLTAWEYSIRTYVPCKPGANNDLQDRLLALLRQVPPDATDCNVVFKSTVAKWYDEAMARASGEYRRRLQKWLFIIGCLLAVGFNCDALRIATVLYQSPTLREQVAQQAETLVKAKPATPGNPAPKPPETASPVSADDAVTTDLKAQLKENVGQLRDLTKIGFPIGWAPVWRDNFILKPVSGDAPKQPAAPAAIETTSWFPDWLGRLWRSFISVLTTLCEPGITSYLAKFAGLFACALAVCLGAPFWFDLLGRLVKLRSSAGADAEKKNSDSTDTVTATVSSNATGTTSAATATSATGTTSGPALRQLPSFLDALGAPTTDFTAGRAYWLAQAADHAYETNRDTVRTWLRLQGQTDVQFFDQPGTNTQAFLSWGNGVALLAFRGTEQNLTDWTTDAKFEFVDGGAHGLPGKIHIGFAEALDSIWPDLLAALGQLKGQRALLHITGHSLGGALTTLAALRLARQRTLAIQSVHTYGSPRVGDETFVREFDASFSGRAFRIVNNEDLVTRIPPRESGYDHVCEIIYIDEAGRLQRDIGYWYRFLNFVTNALDDLKKALQTTVKDHSMTLYCGHLERAARNPETVV